MRIEIPGGVPQWVVSFAQSIQAYVDNTARALYALRTRTITAGTGLSGGGDLTADRTLSVTLTLAAGTYTPSLTNTTNLDSSTTFQCQYMRVGSVVDVSGKVSINPTAPGSVVLGISLPIASDITAPEGCAGAAVASGIAGQSAAILGDATNNRATLQFIAVDLTDQPMYFDFTYLIT